MTNDDRLETEHFTAWQADDGVLRQRWVPGTTITLAHAKQAAEYVIRKTDVQPCPLIVHLDGVRGMEREARTYITTLGGPTAVALVGVAPIARLVGNMFLGLNAVLEVPIRVFADEEAALAWFQTIDL